MAAFTHPLSKPWLVGRELEYVTQTVTDGWLSSQGPFVTRFEEAFARYNHARYGVACSSGTAALTLALRALGVGPGDEVIVPEFTFVATAWAVTYTGATPVFVDCRDDLDIDPDLVEERITPRTKVIIPVHVFGRRCDMGAILELAHEYNLRVVEDSAEAHGVRPVADVACFSLFANKIISCGEGGICVTDDPWLARQMAYLRSMAFDRDRSYLHKMQAYNFRISSMQAAVALAQTEQVEEALRRRRTIERRYDNGLHGLDDLVVMPPRDVLWMYDLRSRRRDDLRKHLAAHGIETRPYFKPMSRQPGYLDPRWPSLNAHRLSEEGLCLPTHTGLTEQEQDEIVGCVQDFCRGG